MTQFSTGYAFISYSRRDTAVMQRIVECLRSHGIKVWVDNEKLVPGTAIWEEEIEKAIQNAGPVVAVMSPDSKGSEWVRREISLAEQYHKRIFPVLVRGDKDSALTLRLITMQFVDIRTNENAGLESLSNAIISYLSGSDSQEEQATRADEKPIPDAQNISYSNTLEPSGTPAIKPISFSSPLKRLLIGAMAGAVTFFIMYLAGGYFATDSAIASYLIIIGATAGLITPPGRPSLMIVGGCFLASAIFFNASDSSIAGLNYFAGTGFFFGVPLGAVISRILYWLKIIK